MKMLEKINVNLFAPCGMNCLVCYTHCASQKACPGCYQSGVGKPGHCRTCAIKDCVHEKGLMYCYECADFPCGRIKRLERSYQTRYGVSLVENSLYVKENGLAAFEAVQKRQYTCVVCGGVISLHDR